MFLDSSLNDWEKEAVSAEPKRRRISRFGREAEKVFNLLLGTDH